MSDTYERMGRKNRMRRRYGNMDGYCCGSGSTQYRGFLTRAEKVEMLQEYKEYLEKESKGVAERIKDLEKKE